MKRPLTFAWRNLVFARDIEDCWALFRLHTCSYAGMPTSGKQEVLASLVAFAANVEADFQLLRVTRAWSPESYVSMAAASLDGRHGDRERFDALVAQHERRLRDRSPLRPEVFVAIRLAGRGPSRRCRCSSAAVMDAGAHDVVSWLLGRGELTMRRLNREEPDLG